MTWLCAQSGKYIMIIKAETLPIPMYLLIIRNKIHNIIQGTRYGCVCDKHGPSFRILILVNKNLEQNTRSRLIWHLII